MEGGIKTKGRIHGSTVCVIIFISVGVFVSLQSATDFSDLVGIKKKSEKTNSPKNSFLSEI